MSMPDTELSQFLLSLGFGAFVGAMFAVPVFISRWRAGEKLIQQKGPNPPWTWPLGTITFGGLAISQFLIDRPIFGSTFAILFTIYLIGMIHSSINKKSNQTTSNH